MKMLNFADDYDQWLVHVTRLGAYVVFEESCVFRAFVGGIKVGAFGKLPGHGYCLETVPTNSFRWFEPSCAASRVRKFREVEVSTND